MTIAIMSILLAVVIPRLTSSKRQALAAAVGNDLRTFATAFETYAQEKGTFPAEVDAGVLPPEIRERLWPFLDDQRARGRETRPREDVLADLMRSHLSIMLNLEELKQRARETAVVKEPTDHD